MRRFFVVFTLLMLAGCSSDESDATAEKEEWAKDSKATAVSSRDSIAGRWVLEIFIKETAFPLAVVDIKQKDAEWAVELVTSQPIPGGLSVQEAKSDGKDLQLLLGNPNIQFHFVGKFSEGTVFGNTMHPQGIDPTILLPTSLTTLDNEKPRAMGAFQQVHKASQDIDPMGELRSYIRNNPTSPATLTAYSLIVRRAGKEKLSPEAIKELITEYESTAKLWGTRISDMTRFNVAMNLGSQQYLPDLALELVDEFGKDATEPEMKQAAQNARKNLEVIWAMDAMENSIADRQDKSREILATVLKQDPLNGPVRWTMGVWERDHGSAESAMDHFGTLSVLPKMEEMIMSELSVRSPDEKAPSEQFRKLFTEKNGSADGLEAYADELYTKAIHSLGGEKIPARGEGEGNKRVLVELLTGAQCQPCVGADLATDLLQQIYLPSELIALRYHQHVPAADPFASKKTQSRMGYYGATGTPSFYLNGREVGGVGGHLRQVNQMQAALQPLIADVLKESSSIEIQATAVREGDSIQISASATGVKIGVDSQLKLRTVLAESDIRYTAGNGIRLHNMIVRDMPSGVSGVPISDPKIEFSKTVSIAEIKKNLNDELDAVGELRGAKISERPMEFTNLKLVAMIQDDTDKKILQALVVDVTPGKVTTANQGSKKKSAATAAN